MMIYHKLALILPVVLLLTGCASLLPERPDNPDYAPVSAEQMQQPKRSDGAIYNNQTSMALFESIRARRVGDMLTVNLIEETDGSKSASTTGQKDDSVDLENATIFGQPVLFDQNKRSLQMTMNGTRAFNGSGDSKQNNNLRGTITVTVYKVLPNGNLMIRGEKWVRINQGDEYIRLKGIVRPADINPDNTVQSQRIANARITYSGTGQVASTNEQGWLSRFFNSKYWLF